MQRDQPRQQHEARSNTIHMKVIVISLAKELVANSCADYGVPFEVADYDSRGILWSVEQKAQKFRTANMAQECWLDFV